MTSHSAQPAKTALVTGASTGIGQATATALAASGWRVYALARREDRLADLAAKISVVPVAADVTDDADVARVLKQITADGGLDTLVNIAGGARGTDTVGEAKTEDWDWMYQVNVLGTMKLIRAFLPMLRENQGTVLNVTSTAALTSYEGGGGYNAAKSAQSAFTAALRLEEAENNVRVIEVLPGLVKTEEFALRRLGGDESAAHKVYAGVAEPLIAEDVADVVAYAVNAPHHVNLDSVVIRPVKQAANHKLIRDA